MKVWNWEGFWGYFTNGYLLEGELALAAPTALRVQGIEIELVQLDHLAADVAELAAEGAGITGV